MIHLIFAYALGVLSEPAIAGIVTDKKSLFQAKETYDRD